MEWNALLEILAAAVGTLGFALVFHIRGKKIFYVTFGGILGWALYLLLGLFFENEFARYLIVSVAVSLYAEIMARCLRTPTTVFNVVCLIPLVPGGALYYTMTSALSGSADGFLTNGIRTLSLAAALSLGVVLVNTSFVYIKRHSKRKK